MDRRTKPISKTLVAVSCLVLLNLVSGAVVAPAEPHAFPAVTTEHVLHIEGKDLKYRTTVGLMPIHDEQGRPMATMSYFAYQLVGTTPRPVTFIWAGGPGNSSLADNFLVSGPCLVDLKTGATTPNASTWLRFSDLVYIDMVGTGWGRPQDPALRKKIYTPAGDAYTFSGFIETYLNQTGNHQSAIYLAGESYGGYRAPLVANNLLKSFISVQGIVLQSPYLNPGYSSDGYDSIQSYALAVPTFVRTALYYKKLSPELQSTPQQTIDSATNWALSEYPHLLLLGNGLTANQKAALEDTLHRYTGISKELLRNNDCRLSMSVFRHHLLADEGRVLDYTNATMSNYPLHGEYGVYVLRMRSIMNSLMPLYEPALRYAESTLGVKVARHYVNYFDPTELWSWGNRSATALQVVSVLRDDMVIADNLRLFVGVGYYDTDIPYIVTTTLVGQIFPSSLRARIALHHYQGGHMFATDPRIRDPFNRDVEGFFRSASAPPEGLDATRHDVGEIQEPGVSPPPGTLREE